MVTVIGLGFVGLTTALGFAEFGHLVFGFDNDTAKVFGLKNRKIGFAEPFLEEKLNEHIGHRFIVDEEMVKAIAQSALIFICVGSPCQENGAVDLGQVISAVKDVLSSVPADGLHRTIVIKSTVPPGTCKRVVEPIIRAGGFSDQEISIASNPEFLREGSCWVNFTHPSKIVIGSDNQESIAAIKSLYGKVNAPIHIVSSNCAEFSKYLSNVMLATLISFSNELAHAAELFGDVDVVDAFRTLHDDDRLKNGGIASYLYPGCGYGGYCLPKDIAAFATALREVGYRSRLLESVIEINQDVIEHLCDKVVASLNQGQSVGVLGLSFKPGSDDVRETAAAKLIEGLSERGVKRITVFDPLATNVFLDTYPELEVESAESAQMLINEVDVVVIATAWEEFATLDYSGKQLFDGRYYISKEKICDE